MATPRATRQSPARRDCALTSDVARASVSADFALNAILDEIDDACEVILLLNAKIKKIEQHIRPLVRSVAPDLLKASLICAAD